MIIIPGRLKSSRFEQKILVDVLGLPMIIRTAKRVSNIDEVVIATDSDEVVKLAKKYNIQAVLTKGIHHSGTDRINEAATILNLSNNDIIINVQADEPFIEPEVVLAVKNEITNLQKKNENFIMVSCYKEIDSEMADDSNHVKVVVDSKNYAIYFSRSKIPHHRDHYNKQPYFGHLGIYGFNRQSLKNFCSLPQASIENIEKLEQLRAIYNQLKIKMVKVESKSFGIDTKEDLINAIELLG
jgi:3-deoxy-manno-octulosonate cytidylyltransferase (CMP-KDO synthetase)